MLTIISSAWHGWPTAAVEGHCSIHGDALEGIEAIGNTSGVITLSASAST
jgi:hypothetical protein